MNSLKFFAEKQHLTGAEQAFVVANSVEYLTVEIEFSSEWENCANTVVFKTSAGEAFSVRLEENGICTVPWEVIAQPYFSMSIYGIYEETRITTNEVIVKVEPSGYAEGKTPQPPTPSVYEKISNQLNSLGTAAQKNVGNLAGEIPIINSYGKLDSAILPRIPEEITDLLGILPINQGGTGATTENEALSNLGAANTEDIGNVDDLETDSKIIVGAINENVRKIGNLTSEISTLNGSLEATLNGN